VFSVTLALAILLGAGVVAARLARLARLPSVTGYIVAGLLLGPFGLGLIDEQTAGHDLGHFTHLALMLIAFGIGEHLELAPLRRAAKVVSAMGLGESAGALVLVGLGTFLAAWLLGWGGAGWAAGDCLVFALLLGAMAVATAPASILHVTRELGATGKLTSTLLAVVAVDNGLAIILFGLIFTIAKNLVATTGGSLFIMVGRSFGDTLLALGMGLAAGLLLDVIIVRLKHRAEMLTVGLAVLLLCGETARLLNLSPLLAGIAVGFIVVNHGRRDVRIFRAINDFEPPIYVLFFTLAGAHVDLGALGVAGGLALLYFLLRAAGKIGGAYLGGRLAGAPDMLSRLLGVSLLPQAGVAIGLVFLVQGEPGMKSFSEIITPLVLGSVVLAELVGPVCTRLALTRAGETGEQIDEPSAAAEGEAAQPTPSVVGGLQIYPWAWDPLTPPARPRGVVVFGLDHPDTAVGLARIATIIGHYFGALPMGLRVCAQDCDQDLADEEQHIQGLVDMASAEVESIGYPLTTEVISADNLIEGFVQATRRLAPRALVLGHQLRASNRDMLRIAEAVAGQNICPVVVVRFGPVLSTRKILVPMVDRRELKAIGEVVTALARVGMHQFTLLQCLDPQAPAAQAEQAEAELMAWADEAHLGQHVTARAAAAESRAEVILAEAASHDLVVMAARRSHRVEKIFLGSLASDIINRCDSTVLLVHRPIPADD